MLGKEERRRNLTITILSLSLLTVMAGAAVAPALDYIKTYFSGVDQTLVQMIISIPSLFMALTNFIFPKLCKMFRARTLLLGGLALYVVGGCAAGLSFVHLKKALGMKVKFAAPLFFFIGYASLFVLGGWAGAIIGSVFIGFANGVEIPFVISTASQKVGRAAGTTVVPMISFSMYMAQFVTPMILNGVSGFIPAPYAVAAISAAMLIIWSVTIKGEAPRHAVIQEQ